MATVQRRTDEGKQEVIAIAQTKQDGGLNQGSGSGEGEERKLFLPQAVHIDKGRNDVHTPEGWFLYTVDLEPYSYF